MSESTALGDNCQDLGMLLTPRYGSNPVLTLDGDPGAVGALVIAQRRRFVHVVADLDEEQWAHPSRCAGWSSGDVAAHLATTNFFWEASIRAGIEGTPTRLMGGFDPVTSPARMVAESAQSAREVVDSLTTSTASLAACIDGLDPAAWTALAESPPGHVSVSTVAHHALWDSWIHERDVMLPLGMAPVEEPDEVGACLRYVAGLTPSLALNAGAERVGSFDVAAEHPDVSFHVDIDTEVSVSDEVTGDDFTLAGSAVELIEALSFRAPLVQAIPTEIEWAFTGLATVFDR